MQELKTIHSSTDTSRISVEKSLTLTKHFNKASLCPNYAREGVSSNISLSTSKANLVIRAKNNSYSN